MARHSTLERFGPGACPAHLTRLPNTVTGSGPSPVALHRLADCGGLRHAARGQTPAAGALGHTARGALRYGSLGVAAADANARHDTRMKTSMKLVAAVLFAACLAHA